MLDTTRRLGRFIIPGRVIAEYPADVRAIMGRCIITRCEMYYHADALEYIALSPDFDVVTEGSNLPEYRATVEDGVVTWTKIDAR